MNKRKFVWLVVLLFITAISLRAQYKVIHSLLGSPSEGSKPYGGLILSDSILYGMTSSGGENGLGAIFRINTDGTGFMLLHSFSLSPSDGYYPLGSLVLVGSSSLYGMTPCGGAYGYGTIFKINLDGTGFIVLHSFAGGAWDGEAPIGSLLLSGSVLYGMTELGGQSDLGTIFRIGLDGTGFVVLHSFAGAPWEGSRPYGHLILCGSMFYGMTWLGGLHDRGSIFRINPDGSGFTMLHSFAGGVSDGSVPLGSLVFSGSVLYGMTQSGGAGNWGTIFRMGLNGSGFALLRSLSGGAADGAYPLSPLTLKDSVLFGTIGSGGPSGLGSIFQINTDGSGFKLLHSFAGGASDGAAPRYGSLILNEPILYGMTRDGGTAGLGVLFSYDVPYLDRSDIVVTKSTSDLKPHFGDLVVFTITAKNTGPDNASGLKVADKLPAGLAYVSSSPTQGTYDPASGVWDLETLNPSNFATLTLQVKATRMGLIKNTASKVAQIGVDPNSSNNSQSVTIQVAPVVLCPVVLVTPSNNSAGLPTSVTLTWQDTNSSPQELKYKVRIKKAGGAYAYSTLAAGTTSFIKSGLAKGKTYYWSVQAIGNGASIKNSTWPPDWRFTTL